MVSAEMFTKRLSEAASDLVTRQRRESGAYKELQALCVLTGMELEETVPGFVRITDPNGQSFTFSRADALELVRES